MEMAESTQKENSHGYDHAFDYCSHRSSARRRLVWPGTLVLSDAASYPGPRVTVQQVLWLRALRRHGHCILRAKLGRATNGY
jgi:hypothetical protein